MLWAVLFVASLTGCQSSRITGWDDLDLFLRFRVDGTLVEYTSLGNVYGVFTHSNDSGRDGVQVAAWDSTSGFGLEVSSLQAPTRVGTYSIAQLATDPTFRLVIYYLDSEGTGYSAQPVVPEDATIVISHIGSMSIGGTFFGVVGAPDRADVIITDGEFMVRREHDIITGS